VVGLEVSYKIPKTTRFSRSAGVNSTTEPCSDVGWRSWFSCLAEESSERLRPAAHGVVSCLPCHFLLFL
jgi:hypothetical protein